MTENRRPYAPWLALAVLALGLFMTLLDLTIVNVAIQASSTTCTPRSTRSSGCSTATAWFMPCS